MRRAALSMAVFLLLLPLGSAGCSSMADVAGKKASGTAAVYAVSTDQAWEIAKSVFRSEGCDAI